MHSGQGRRDIAGRQGRRWQAPSDDEAGEGDAGGELGPVDGGAPGAGLGQAGPLPWLGLDWNDLRSTTSYHNVFQYFN